MPRALQSLFTFNRGIISRLGLARMDVKRLSLAAAQQLNFIPRVLGSAMLRPGLQFIGSSLNNGPTKLIDFVKRTTDTALLEVTPGQMRVWINDVLVTYVQVGTTITNGTFATNIAGWDTTSTELGGTVSYNSTIPAMEFASNGTAAAIADQSITIAFPDRGKEHCLGIHIANGPITLRVGTSKTDDSLINETILENGDHRLAFTPTTPTANIRFLSRQIPVVDVSFVAIMNLGTAYTLSVPAPWQSGDLSNLRWAQSADVVFVACTGLQQRRIERRAPHSWSVVLYKTPDGPFLLENVSATTLGVSALSGNITVTASRPTFKVPVNLAVEGQRGDVGSLLQIISSGQTVTVSITAQNTFTNPIKVTGVGQARIFALTLSGLTGTGNTVTIQYSVGVPGIWVTEPNGWATGPFTTNQANLSIQDGLDNQIIYYRVGIDTGNYVGGTTVATLTYGGGSITGTVRITAVPDILHANAEVLITLGNTAAVTTWSKAEWSDVNGWPSAVTFHEGRLWWSGQDSIDGSVSDAFNSFDPTIIGDAGPLDRTIGEGPVDRINFLLPLQRLIIGAEGSEWSARSTALDDVLTPTNFNLKSFGGQGSAALPAMKIDQRGVFVNRTGVRAYELVFGFQFYEYQEIDLTAVCPDVLKPGVVRMARQRQPDTRVHFILSDGTAVVMVNDPNEEVNGFVRVNTAGTIEDVAVLPAKTGQLDDQVYYIVNRALVVPQIFTNNQLGSLTPHLWNDPGGGGTDPFSVTVIVPANQFTGPYVAFIVPMTASVTAGAFGTGPTSVTVTDTLGTVYTLATAAIKNAIVGQSTIDFRLLWAVVPVASANLGFTVTGTFAGADTHWSGQMTFATVDGFGAAAIFDGANAQIIPITAGTAYTPTVTTTNDLQDFIFTATWQSEQAAGGGGSNDHSTIGAGLTLVYPYLGCFKCPQLAYGYGSTLSKSSSVNWTADAGTPASNFSYAITLALSRFGTGSSGPFPGMPTNGRFLEKWAQEDESRGVVVQNDGVTFTSQQLCKLGDSFIAQTFPTPQTVITGLSHLEGQNVTVWADGTDVGTNDSTTTWTLTYTVSGGQITLATAASNVVVGLPYTAQFQSAKLGLAMAGMETPLNQPKRGDHIGLILADLHPRGLRFGATFDQLRDMPLIEAGLAVGTTPYAAYDQQMVEFPGTWTPDLRICLQAVAPRPVTLMAVSISEKEK